MKNYAKKYLSLFVAVLMAMMMLIPTAAFAATPTAGSSFTISAEDTVLRQGEYTTVTATISSDATFNNENVTWSVDKTYVDLSTTSGSSTVLTANGTGTGTVTITGTISNAYQDSDGEWQDVTATTTVYIYDANEDAEEITLDETQILVEDGTETLTALASDGSELSDATSIEWTSSDTSILTVSGDGTDTATLTPVSSGIVTVTATNAKGETPTTATCTVYVDYGTPHLVNHIYIDGETAVSYDLASVGSTQDITITAYADSTQIPDEIVADLINVTASGDVSVTAKDEENYPAVYTVTATGVGTGKVSASIYQKTSATATFTVSDNPVETITLDPDEDTTITLGDDAFTVTAAVTGADSSVDLTDPTLTWTSSAPDVATVEKVSDPSADYSTDGSATVTGVGFGKTVITVTANDGSGATATLNVFVQGFKFNSDSYAANKGDEFTVPYGSYNVASIVWSSSDTSVATVDEDGKVTVVGYGNAVITAKATMNDGTTVTDSMTINSSADNGNAVYRLYNRNSGEHFYTTDADEKDNLVSLGWKDEGIGWYGASEEDGIPVYRLYNANAGEHHYTTDADEKDTLVSAGWSYEGIEFYASEDETDYPVYRNYNPNAYANNHNFTTNEDEYEGLIDIGWNDEGIAFYAVNPGSNG